MKIKIVVTVRKPSFIPPEPTQPKPPDNQLPFTEDVVLQRYGRKRPGRGLPKKEEDRYVGIHMGTLTFLRLIGQGDRFYKPGIHLVIYVAAYRFYDLAKTPLKKGQITTHGVLLVDSATHTRFETPNKYAITGGTDAYAKARGEVIELGPTSEDRELYIDL
jgi:hypothetical protein